VFKRHYENTNALRGNLKPTSHFQIKEKNKIRFLVFCFVFKKKNTWWLSFITSTIILSREG